MKRRVDEVETARKVPRVCVCLGADKSKRVSDSAIPSNGALLHFYWINVKTFKHMNLHFFSIFSDIYLLWKVCMEQSSRVPET